MKSRYCVQQALHVDVNPCTTLSSNYICLARIIPVLCFLFICACSNIFWVFDQLFLPGSHDSIEAAFIIYIK